jgi:D-psicose/D-tagatose/L-ribulose 3-epimerase
MTNRRQFLLQSSATLLAMKTVAATKGPFRYSICNEVFEKRDFRESCKLARTMGYTGLEIAPFTLADNVNNLSPARRKELREILHGEGLQFVGLHWLFVKPDGLHITTADAAVRQKSWAYLNDLIDFCGDMREGQSETAVMVLGSPKQRGTTPGTTRTEATKRLAEGLASVGDRALARKCVVCMETLDHSQTDVDNTLAETVEIVKQVNKPAIQTMFDFHNTPDEKDSPDVLVARYFPMIRHVHINEMDGRWPGTGKSDYVPLLRTLKKLKYKGWVSLEVFDFKMGAERIGREAIEYLKGLEAKL